MLPLWHPWFFLDIQDGRQDLNYYISAYIPVRAMFLVYIPTFMGSGNLVSVSITENIGCLSKGGHIEFKMAANQIACCSYLSM
jgi:hypothetical protein